MTVTRITTIRNSGGLAAAIVLVLTMDVWGVGVYSENAVCPQ